MPPTNRANVSTSKPISTLISDQARERFRRLEKDHHQFADGGREPLYGCAGRAAVRRGDVDHRCDRPARRGRGIGGDAGTTRRPSGCRQGRTGRCHDAHRLGLSRGATVTIAGATLLQRVAGAVVKFGGNVLSTQLDMQGPQTRTGFLSMIASCEIEQAQVQQLLYDLEAGMPFRRRSACDPDPARRIRFRKRKKTADFAGRVRTVARCEMISASR